MSGESAPKTFDKTFARRDTVFTKEYRFETELKFSKLYREFNPAASKILSFDRSKKTIRYEYRRDFESDMRKNLAKTPMKLWREIEAFSEYCLKQGLAAGLKNFTRLYLRFLGMKSGWFSGKKKNLFDQYRKKIERRLAGLDLMVGNYDGLVANAKVVRGRIILIDFEWYCRCPKEYLLARLTTESGTFFKPSKSNPFGKDLYFLLILAFLFEILNQYPAIRKRLAAHFSEKALSAIESS